MRSLLLFTAFVLSGCAAASPEPTQPNIVVILADDLGYGDVGAYNPNSKIPTPHMDRLAAEGLLFTDAHSPSAVCTPTRYGLLTGRYAWRTGLKRGVTWGYDPMLPDTARATIADVLREAGYATAGIGKWHLGLGTADSVDYHAGEYGVGPNDLGFDHYFGIPASLDMELYVYIEDGRTVQAPTDYIDAEVGCCMGPFYREGPIAADFDIDQTTPVLAERAVAYIEEASATEQPFFLYLPLPSPHTPWVPTPAFDGISQAGMYGDFVAQVDAVVGQVLDALDAHGLAESTLIAVTSDNGAYWPDSEIERFEHRANGPWRGMKADIWEAGHRVPLLIRWPGRIGPRTTTDGLTMLTDLFATFAASAGATIPDDAAPDSYDQSPLFDAPDQAVREHGVMHSSRGVFAIRRGPWKLIRGLGSGGFTRPAQPTPEPGGPTVQLYHLGDDPGETTNLALERPEMVADLSNLLDQQIRQGHSQPVASDETWGALFDGTTFGGWDGPRPYFRIEDDAIVAGTLDAEIPKNQFLCTQGEYTD
ncbi:MAG: sulfatase-like hydrolase/transferase, partial [Bacteroidota bacterium]